MSVKNIAANVEILTEASLPLRVPRKQSSHPVAIVARSSAVSDLKALAVIGQDHERIGPPARPRAGKQGLKQANRQGRKTQDFQNTGGNSNRSFCFRPRIAPDESQRWPAPQGQASRPSGAAIPKSGKATSSTAPQSFIVPAHTLCKLRRNRVAIDGNESIGRFASADLLGDSLAKLIHRLGHQISQFVPVGLFGMTLDFLSFPANTVAKQLPRLASQGCRAIPRHHASGRSIRGILRPLSALQGPRANVLLFPSGPPANRPPPASWLPPGADRPPFSAG